LTNDCLPSYILEPISLDHYLLSWYSSPVEEETGWLEGQFSPSDIWLADVDFTQAPSECTPPERERACEPPALPPHTEVFDITGQFLMSLAPVIWPTQPVFFYAYVIVKGSRLDFTLQPLEPTTKEPVGPPWTKRNVPIADDGSFTVDFGTKLLPSAAYPVLESPIPLTLEGFRLTGKTISNDLFCGNVTGRVQVLPGNSDRILLSGSTFGASRITGDTLPEPVSSCQNSF